MLLVYEMVKEMTTDTRIGKEVKGVPADRS